MDLLEDLEITALLAVVVPAAELVERELTMVEVLLH
jgi:hypothetical protein